MIGKRGVRAALPTDDHHRPAVLDALGVVVVHVNEKGDERALYDFSTLPVSGALQRSLAALFAGQLAPTGPWRSIVTSREVWGLLGTFARWLSTLESPPVDVEAISPAIWNQWRVSRAANPLGERQIRKIGVLLRTDARLPAATYEATLKRVARQAATESAYSPEQFEAIKQTVTASVRAAWQRISDNRRHLAAWRAGQFGEGTQEWVLGHTLDHLARTGDVPTYVRESDGTRQIPWPVKTALGGFRSEFTWQRLYLNVVEVVSLAALMVISYGWNSTTISELAVPEIQPDAAGGPEIYRVELEKRRRGTTHRYETRNLTDWGPNAPGRLITRAIEATTPARDLLAEHGAATDRLLVWHVAKPLLVADRTALLRLGFSDMEIKQWKAATGTTEMNLRRLRRTVTVLHRREPTQHSQDVHDSVYVLRDPAAHEQAAPVIAEGIAEAIAHAQAVVARVSRNDRDGQTGADTATANCGDYTHSPFSPHGSPCRASFLLCLACTNAVITPRHLPRLAYLHQTLDALRAVLPAEVWDHDWREHHARLTHLKGSAFTPTEWTDALHAVSPTDRTTIDSLLRKGFDS